jgi:hypothetical protein
MQHHANDQDDPNRPQHLANHAQKVPISVDLRRPLEDLQVARQMADHKQEQNRPRHRHHSLLAVGGLPETRCPGFACLLACLLTRASDRHTHRGHPAILIGITSEASFSSEMQRFFKANLYYSCPEEAPSTSRTVSQHPVHQIIHT